MVTHEEYVKNKEKYKAYNKQYNISHVKKHSEAVQKWKAEHKEGVTDV